MKKQLFLLMISGCIITACNDNKNDKTPATDLGEDSTATTKPFDWSKVYSISEEEVVKMAAHYTEIISKDPTQCIQQIRMDGSVLEAVLYETERIKLIAAADLKSNDITAIVQLFRSGVPSFYRITDFFNPNQPGMRGQVPVCPPPAECGLPLSGHSTRPHLITENEASEMAKLYVSLVKANPKIAIRQINMDGALLYALLYKTKGIQLIAAADLKTKETTEIMQLWRGGVFLYFDVKDVFTPGMPGMQGKVVICPPPDSCRND